MLRTIALSVAALVAAFPAYADPSREHAHVRPVHRDLAKLLDEGAARSTTLRALIDQLQHSDVVVMMEFDNGLPNDLAGGLRFVTRAGSLRILRVSIRRTLARPQIIATIAHELRHALEVADAPEIVDAESLVSYYRRVDLNGGFKRFDTLDAQRTGDDVGLELQTWRREQRLALQAATPQPQRRMR